MSREIKGVRAEREGLNNGSLTNERSVKRYKESRKRVSRPGVKLTLGGENEKGIYNLQRSVQDASCRGN